LLPRRTARMHGHHNPLSHAHRRVQQRLLTELRVKDGGSRMLARDTAFRLPRKGRLDCPPQLLIGAAQPIQSCSDGQRSPKSVPAHCLPACGVQPVTCGTRGAWGRGVLLLGLLAPIFLAGCAAPPRLVQGDSTNNAWYAKMQLTKF
jgi:hypothetical protein